MPRSSIKELPGELSRFEEESKRLLNSQNYFVVKANIKFREWHFGHFEHISYKLLEDDFQGLKCVYVNEIDEIILIFDRGNDKFNNYNFIISTISLQICKHCEGVDNIETLFLDIAEFPSKPELLIYISLEAYNSTRRNMRDMSKGNISDTDFYMKTDHELIKILEDNEISWEAASSHKKYGQFIRKDFEKLSEHIDTRNIKKYTNFIFRKEP